MSLSSFRAERRYTGKLFLWLERHVWDCTWVTPWIDCRQLESALSLFQCSAYTWATATQCILPRILITSTCLRVRTSNADKVQPVRPTCQHHIHVDLYHDNAVLQTQRGKDSRLYKIKRALSTLLHVRCALITHHIWPRSRRQSPSWAADRPWMRC